MKKILVLVLLLSVGLNIGLGARMLGDSKHKYRDQPGWGMRSGFGSDRNGGHGRGGGDRDGTFWRGVMERRLNHVAEQLGLDEEQAESFKKAHKVAAEKFLEQRTKVMEARGRLRDAASKPVFETSSLRPLIAEVGRQQAKLDSMVTETMLQEMEILDEDQRRLYMSILPLNRFAGRSGGPGHPPRHGGR